MTLDLIDCLIVVIPFLCISVVAWRARRYMKSVADFMSAGRCARRYLICTASGEAARGAISVVAIFEYIHKAGFTMTWWNMLSAPVGLMVTLTGFVIYRYRETRAMTLAQFFEIRYSKGFRVFAGLLGFLSGLVNYGIFPAVGARFFINYCNWPQTLIVSGFGVPTLAILMLLFLGFALFLNLAGGQLTVMVSNFLSGSLSSVFYIIVVFTLLKLVSWSQISEAMALAPPGHSMLNPFEAKEASDFNLWFVLIALFGMVYGAMSWQGGHGYRSSAVNPHEAKMGEVLGNWRATANLSMILLIGICGFTYMTHPDFSAAASDAHDQLAAIDSPQIQSQSLIPVALAHLLPSGIRGLFAAIMFSAMIACDSSYLHSWGSIFVQDVIVPLRKIPLTPKAHIRLLRWSIVGVAGFAFFFSLLFIQTDYILMFMALTGAIFAGGSGCAIIGGLYWRRGTTAGAWSGMITGGALAVTGIVSQQAWKGSVPTLLLLTHPFADHGALALYFRGFESFLAAHSQKFPVNGQVVFFFTMLASLMVYVAVSLVTYKTDFNLERMLHRGEYAVTRPPHELSPNTSKWMAAIGFDRAFTRGDKVISSSLLAWAMLWLLVFVMLTIWYSVSPWPLRVWIEYWYVVVVVIPVVLVVVTTVWFTWGGILDFIQLFRDLAKVKRNPLDDGSVVSHHNLDV
ncbi:MAG: sodium:proline symporter [Verrucomicrobiota bacterium]